MSDQYPNPVPSYGHTSFQTPEPPKTKWYKKPLFWVPAVTAVVFFSLGSGQAKVETKEVPGPERVVTQEVTPTACMQYIDLSEQAFTASAEAMGYMSDVIDAASNLDVAAIHEANAGLESVNPKMRALTDPMAEAKDACEAAK